MHIQFFLKPQKNIHILTLAQHYHLAASPPRRQVFLTCYTGLHVDKKEVIILHLHLNALENSELYFYITRCILRFS